MVFPRYRAAAEVNRCIDCAVKELATEVLAGCFAEPKISVASMHLSFTKASSLQIAVASYSDRAVLTAHKAFVALVMHQRDGLLLCFSSI
eukprot:17550-Heterococcus_DN1.PRE.3